MGVFVNNVRSDITRNGRSIDSPSMDMEIRDIARLTSSSTLTSSKKAPLVARQNTWSGMPPSVCSSPSFGFTSRS
jgi:hypothetical protein|tara:strand:- start:703 stop:927 length:225 start_codon:yes stop_codon:yes gene_type:complete